MFKLIQYINRKIEIHKLKKEIEDIKNNPNKYKGYRNMNELKESLLSKK